MLIDYQNVSIYQADKCVLKGINFHVDEGAVSYTHLTLPTICSV